MNTPRHTPALLAVIQQLNYSKDIPIPPAILREDVLAVMRLCPVSIQEAYAKGGQLGLVEWLHNYSSLLMTHKYQQQLAKQQQEKRVAVTTEFRRNEHGTFPHNI